MIKILGVEIDNSLNFKHHVSAIIKKCNGKLRFLWRTASNLPPKIKTLLYNALVVPHLFYCNEVWSPALTAQLKNSLEIIQNNGMRFILNKNRSFSATATV